MFGPEAANCNSWVDRGQLHFLALCIARDQRCLEAMDADEDFFDKFKDEGYDDFFTRQQPSQPAKPTPKARMECFLESTVPPSIACLTGYRL